MRAGRAASLAPGAGALQVVEAKRGHGHTATRRFRPAASWPAPPGDGHRPNNINNKSPHHDDHHHIQHLRDDGDAASRLARQTSFIFDVFFDGPVICDRPAVPATPAGSFKLAATTPPSAHGCPSFFMHQHQFHAHTHTHPPTRHPGPTLRQHLCNGDHQLPDQLCEPSSEPRRPNPRFRRGSGRRLEETHSGSTTQQQSARGHSRRGPQLTALRESPAGCPRQHFAAATPPADGELPPTPDPACSATCSPQPPCRVEAAADALRGAHRGTARSQLSPSPRRKLATMYRSARTERC